MRHWLSSREDVQEPRRGVRLPSSSPAVQGRMRLQAGILQELSRRMHHPKAMW
jgi:hypothetical protein